LLFIRIMICTEKGCFEPWNQAAYPNSTILVIIIKAKTEEPVHWDVITRLGEIVQ